MCVIPIDEKNPIESIKEGIIHSFSGDATWGFKVELPAVFSLSDKDYEAYHQTWVRALNCLPSHTIVHKQDWFIEKLFSGSSSQVETSFLTAASNKHFKDRWGLLHYSYIYITLPQAQQEKVPQKEFEYGIQLFRNVLNTVVFLFPLTDEELLGNDKEKGILDKYISLLDEEEGQDIDLEHGLAVGNKQCLIYTLNQLDCLPNTISSHKPHAPLSTDRSTIFTSFSAPVGLLLPCNHIYNQYFIIEDLKTVTNQLEKENLTVLSRFLLGARKFRANETEISNFKEEGIKKRRLPIRTHCNLTIWEESEEELNYSRQAVDTAMNKMGCRANLATTESELLFWSGVPGNAGKLSKEHTFLTYAHQASCLITLETNVSKKTSKTSTEVLMRCIDRLYGYPIDVPMADTFNLSTNINKLISGPAGSGRSFFINHLIRQYHQQGTQIMVLETLGDHYQATCAILQGEYIKFSEDVLPTFNPFYTDDDNIDIEKRSFIVQLLFTLWKRDNQEPTGAEYTVMHEAVKMYYTEAVQQKEDQSLSLNGFVNFFRDTFQPYYISLTTPCSQCGQIQPKFSLGFDFKSFINALLPFYLGGEYDYLLNADKGDRYCCNSLLIFNLDVIREHPVLFPLVTVLLQNVFITKLKSKKYQGIRKIIVIEEAWKAVVNEGMAEHLLDLFNRVRTYFGEVVFVTPVIHDVLDNKVIKNLIFNSCDYKIIFDQRTFRYEFDAIANVLDFNEQDKALALSINLNRLDNRIYKEFLIKVGSRESQVFGLEVSLEEQLVYTSDSQVKRILVRYTEELGSLEEAIKTYANEMRQSNYSI